MMRLGEGFRFSDMREYKGIGLVYAKQIHADFVVDTPRGDLVGLKGDYLIRTSCGEVFVSDRDAFESNYTYCGD